MLGLGTGELLVVAILALVVLGPDKLPEAARKLGRVVSELRRMSSGFQAELRDAMQEPVEGFTTPRSPTPKATPPPSNGDAADEGPA